MALRGDTDDGGASIVRILKALTLALLLIPMRVSILHAQTIEVAPESVRGATKAIEDVEKKNRPAVEGAEDEQPPPYFARFKHPLPEFLLKGKKEGRYFTPMPVFGVDPDTGFNIGAMANFFDNGKRTDPLFKYEPYRQQIMAAVVLTSRKLIQVGAYLDQPYIFDTPWRVRGEFEFLRNPVQNYFGIGSAGQQLISPWTGGAFGSYSGYKDNLNQVIGGQTYGRYDEYQLGRMMFQGSAEYDLVGGLIRPLVGIRVARVWIHDYTGSGVNNAVELPTHLQTDCAAGRAIGCSGGFDNYVKLGFTFDTRNFEPDPAKGILHQTSVELSPKFLGSAFNYGRITSQLSGYGELANFRSQQIVLAGRFLYNWQFGDVPFYAMDTLAMNERDRYGLGGLRTMHGYKQDRFIGPVMMLVNMDLRWHFAQFTVFKQDIKLIASPFFDAGRAFDNNSQVSMSNWKLAGGVGLRLAWNLSTIIDFDYGFSPEGSAFYMDLSYPF